jgi:hypothetical protein
MVLQQLLQLSNECSPCEWPWGMYAKPKPIIYLADKIRPLVSLFPMRAYRRNVEIVHNYVQRYVDKLLSLSSEDLANKAKGEMNFLDALALHTWDLKVITMGCILLSRDQSAYNPGTQGPTSRSPHSGKGKFTYIVMRFLLGHIY